jgi:hypothetical protein
MGFSSSEEFDTRRSSIGSIEALEDQKALVAITTNPRLERIMIRRERGKD